jgi:hypothetical protein
MEKGIALAQEGLLCGCGPWQRVSRADGPYPTKPRSGIPARGATSHSNHARCLHKKFEHRPARGARCELSSFQATALLDSSACRHASGPAATVYS